VTRARITNELRGGKPNARASSRRGSANKMPANRGWNPAHPNRQRADQSSVNSAFAKDAARGNGLLRTDHGSPPRTPGTRGAQRIRYDLHVLTGGLHHERKLRFYL
jgi:hypothetical protein